MNVAVCATTKGNLHLLEDSLRATWDVMPHGAGMFVVSSDGRFSRERRVLRRLAAEFGSGFHLTFKRSRRGRGRQLAFQAAVDAGATHVIQGCDTDAIIHPVARHLLELYERHYADHDVLMQTVGWSITRTSFMQAVDGWPDLQVYEDRQVWIGAGRLGRLVWVPIDTTEHVRHPRRLTMPWRYARQWRYQRMAKRLRGRMPGFDAFVMESPDHAPVEIQREVDAVAAQVAQYWRERTKRHSV